MTTATKKTPAKKPAAKKAPAAKKPAPRPSRQTANYESISLQTHRVLDDAFRFFNEKLFDNRLPEAFLMLQRKRGAHGYFHAEQFQERESSEFAHEISLNPQTMFRSETEVLSTLVHEMTHLEQEEYGTPGKNGHHNKEWGDLMDRVGLEPTATGQPGGKRTGRKVTHCITPGGPFEAACAEFLGLPGNTLPWSAITPEKVEKKADTSKVPHLCPVCESKVWGKLGIRVECVDCEEMMGPDPEWMSKHGLS